MEARLTEADLAARLTDVVDRARGGARFVIERNGEAVAILTPPEPEPKLGITGRELLARLGDLMPPGDGFADDLEAIQASQGRVEIREWPD